MLCPRCGYYAEKEDSVCPECGEILNAGAAAPEGGAEAIRQGGGAQRQGGCQDQDKGNDLFHDKFLLLQALYTIITQETKFSIPLSKNFFAWRRKMAHITNQQPKGGNRT